jgi:hypothetical protein
MAPCGKGGFNEARTWRDKYLGRHDPNETDRVLCGDLLDLLIEHRRTAPPAGHGQDLQMGD